jgi:hypothetical protein
VGSAAAPGGASGALCTELPCGDVSGVLCTEAIGALDGADAVSGSAGALAGGGAGGASAAGIEALAAGGVPGGGGAGGGGRVPLPNSPGDAVGEDGSAIGAAAARCCALVRSATNALAMLAKAARSGSGGFGGTVARFG